MKFGWMVPGMPYPRSDGNDWENGLARAVTGVILQALGGLEIFWNGHGDTVVGGVSSCKVWLSFEQALRRCGKSSYP